MGYREESLENTTSTMGTRTLGTHTQLSLEWSGAICPIHLKKTGGHCVFENHALSTTTKFLFD